MARRDAGLDVSDRITVAVSGSPEVGAAVEAHRAFVAREVLADSVVVGKAGAAGFAGEVGEGEQITVVVTRA
jgi:isoleucyl-tRNA synthetase